MDEPMQYVPKIATQSVTIVNADKKPLACLGAQDNYVMLSFLGAKFEPIAIGVADGFAGILLRDREGRPQITISTDPDGIGRIALNGADGQMAVGIAVVAGVLYLETEQHRMPLHEIIGALAQVAQMRRPTDSQN